MTTLTLPLTNSQVLEATVRPLGHETESRGLRLLGVAGNVLLLACGMAACILFPVLCVRRAPR
mgnify:CR=1 FL=1